MGSCSIYPSNRQSKAGLLFHGVGGREVAFIVHIHIPCLIIYYILTLNNSYLPLCQIRTLFSQHLLFIPQIRGHALIKVVLIKRMTNTGKTHLYLPRIALGPFIFVLCVQCSLPPSLPYHSVGIEDVPFYMFIIV